MIFDGINLDGLGDQLSPNLIIPDKVPGRTVHIDADFLAYQTTATRVGEEKSFEDMQHNARKATQTLADLAGAEHVHLHLTPSTSDKGKRYQIALLKEYQGNRADKEKPKYLNLMRQWLAKEFPGTLHQFCEADDGMAASQYRAIKSGKANLSIIASKDKDLSMVPGLHLDWDTGEIIDAEEFGEIWIEQKKSGKKLRGFGQKFFWAQMLMGDSADNISGLPLVHSSVIQKLSPSKEEQKHLSVLKMHPATISEEAQQHARKFLAARPHKKCGPALAYDLLKGTKSNAQAFKGVRALYSLVPEAFTLWTTGEPVPWQRAFVSEAQLLWMRREEHNYNDVLNWMKEIVH